MSGERTPLGDTCQNHDPRAAPVAYPYSATLDLATDNLRAEYRCVCGNRWSCWWSAIGHGWTAEDVERLNLATAREDTGPVRGDWFHRGPCHGCTTCGANGCHVWSDGLNPEIHICANGCDGLPAGLESAA